MPSPVERLTDALVMLSWSLLGALGVPSRLRHHDDWLVDPEAALMLAALLGEADARLFDEALAWAAANADLLSRARMKAIRSSVGDPRNSSAWEGFATSLSRATDGSWPGAVDRGGEEVRPRQRRPAQLTVSPSRLGLRFRAAVGVGTRAEVFAVMLTRSERELIASDLAVFTQTTKRNTAAVLHVLARSGTLQRREHGNKAFYRMAAPGLWAELLGPVPAVAVGWVPLLSGLCRLRDRLHDGLPREGRVADIELRTMLEESATGWHESGLPLPPRFGVVGENPREGLERLVMLAEGLGRGERPESA